MPWKSGEFAGRKVWVEVDAAGAPIVAGGRTPIRYAATEGAKIYRAGAGKIAMGGDAAVDLPAGESDESAPSKSGGGKSLGTSPGLATRPERAGFGSAGSRTPKQAASAAAANAKFIADLPKDTIRAYTDGSSKGNPGPAGAGAVVELPSGRRGECSRALGRTTNNVGELTAVGCALDLLDAAGVEPRAPVAVFTDSSYAHGVLSRGWKAKANTELIRDLKVRLKARPGVALHWIAAHVGTAGNEQADALAEQGTRGVSRTTWIEPPSPA